MSYLKWKAKKNGQKSLFIITNPVTVILCAIAFFEIVLAVIGWLRFLFQ